MDNGNDILIIEDHAIVLLGLSTVLGTCRGIRSISKAQTGKEALESKCGLLTTVGYKIKGKMCYALEGSVFNSGSTVDWAIDNLNIAKTPQELTTLATSIEDNDGVYLVPAFTGLGTPYWDMDARASITGITRGTDKRHIARSVLESMAYSCYDVLNCMEQETGIKIKELHIDGGGSVNQFLMQLIHQTFLDIRSMAV